MGKCGENTVCVDGELRENHNQKLVCKMRKSDHDLCFEFAHLLSNFITLDRKRNLRKPGILPSFDTDPSLFGE